MFTFLLSVLVTVVLPLLWHLLEGIFITVVAGLILLRIAVRYPRYFHSAE